MSTWPRHLGWSGPVVALLMHALVLLALLRSGPQTPPTPPALLSIRLVEPVEDNAVVHKAAPKPPQPTARRPKATTNTNYISSPLITRPSTSRDAATLPTTPTAAALPSVEAPGATPAVAPTVAQIATPSQSSIPEYLENPAPPYPSMSRRKGEQGRVVLRIHVGANGTANELSLASSSGFPRLDDSALATVRHWKFLPARQGNQAVDAWILIPVVFTLKENGTYFGLMTLKSRA